MTRNWCLPLILLAACGTTKIGRYEFSSYSIAAPKGDWGVVKLNEAAEEIQFASARPDDMGKIVQTTLMGVSKVSVAASEAELTEEALVDQFFTRELRTQEEALKAAKNYSFKEVRKGVATVGGKKVYFTGYGVDMGGSSAGGTNGDALHYVYFPPDWKTRRAFYDFGVSQVWREGGPNVLRDLKVVEPLVAGFATR